MRVQEHFNMIPDFFVVFLTFFVPSITTRWFL